MRRIKAFTLVELLIVIAIIAVLISILIPVLGRARQQAQLVACAANLHQIGLAAVAYAQDNQGNLPQRPEDGIYPIGNAASNAGIPWLPAGGNVLAAFSVLNFEELVADDGATGADTSPPLFVVAAGPNLLQPGNKPPCTNSFGSNQYKDPGANIGRLIIKNYMGSYDLHGPKSTVPGGNGWSGRETDFWAAYSDPTVAPFRFCPGQSGDTAAIQLTYESSYLFNPHWANMSPSMQPGVPTPDPYYGYGIPVTWYRQLSKMPKQIALGSDMMDQAANSAWHLINQSKNQCTWNLLFPDAHVSSQSDKFVYGWIRGGRSGNALNRMNDFLDILETEEDGRNPLTSDAYYHNQMQAGYPPGQRETQEEVSNFVPWD